MMNELGICNGDAFNVFVQRTVICFDYNCISVINFHSLEIVNRGSETQLEVSKN